MSETTVTAVSDEVYSDNRKPTYLEVVRRKTGIGKTKNPILLRDLRNDADAVISMLRSQIEELKASINNTEDDLEVLAGKADIETLNNQVSSLNGLKESIAARVTELLKGE